MPAMPAVAQRAASAASCGRGMRLPSVRRRAMDKTLVEEVARQAPLRLELFDVRLHDLGGRGPQLRRHVVPCGIEQRRPRALAAVQGGDELALAVELVLDVLG